MRRTEQKQKQKGETRNTAVCFWTIEASTAHLSVLAARYTWMSSLQKRVFEQKHHWTSLWWSWIKGPEQSTADYTPLISAVFGKQQSLHENKFWTGRVFWDTVCVQFLRMLSSHIRASFLPKFFFFNMLAGGLAIHWMWACKCLQKTAGRKKHHVRNILLPASVPGIDTGFTAPWPGWS